MWVGMVGWCVKVERWRRQQGFIGHLVGFIGALARKSVQMCTQATIPSSTNPDQQAHALSPYGDSVAACQSVWWIYVEYILSTVTIFYPHIQLLLLLLAARIVAISSKRSRDVGLLAGFLIPALGNLGARFFCLAPVKINHYTCAYRVYAL